MLPSENQNPAEVIVTKVAELLACMQNCHEVIDGCYKIIESNQKTLAEILKAIVALQNPRR